MANDKAYETSEFEYGLRDDDSDSEGSMSNRPTIVIMGLKRSGKTSIRKVVFQKMSPNETLFVESTARVTNECKFTVFMLNLIVLEILLDKSTYCYCL